MGRRESIAGEPPQWPPPHHCPSVSWRGSYTRLPPLLAPDVGRSAIVSEGGESPGATHQDVTVALWLRGYVTICPRDHVATWPLLLLQWPP